MLKVLPEVAACLRAGFDKGVTRPVEFRLEQLAKLKKFLMDHEAEIFAALDKDMRKSRMDCVLQEMSILYAELNFFQSKLTSLVKPTVLSRDLGSTVCGEAQPLGVILIFGTFNFPFSVCLRPLIAAIAAGNAVLLKPSEVAPASEAVLTKLADVLDNSVFAVVTGGPDVASQLLELRYDHILYTGSGKIGKIVLAAAAKHLTPVTLELGGKSPAIITASADLDSTASAVIYGRFTNAGQICIAADYVLVEDEVFDRFQIALLAKLKETFGTDPSVSPVLARMCANRHFERVSGLLEKTSGKIIAGGESDPVTRYIAPTVVVLDGPNDALMEEEIFGPILPMMRVSSVEDAIAVINARDKPLSLYIFSTDSSVTRAILDRTSSGSSGVNTTLTQAIAAGGWLGGIGPSGMGAYGFETGFRTFSHMRPVEYVSTLRAKLLSKLVHLGAFNSEKEARNRWMETILRVYLRMPPATSRAVV
jgi:aldehyde dehydrogenase (NAD+)